MRVTGNKKYSSLFNERTDSNQLDQLVSQGATWYCNWTIFCGNEPQNYTENVARLPPIEQREQQEAGAALRCFSVLRQQGR